MNIHSVDIYNYSIIRDSVQDFIKNLSINYDYSHINLLDIAPQVHKGSKEFFKYANIETLDIDPKSNCTYIYDLCCNNSNIIHSNKFDIIICTEVLEHTNNPFDAMNELYRIVKPNGIVAITTPFNFRIHNPLPDNWRFTEYGLKLLCSKFSELTIESIDNSRFLMPVQYRVLAKK